MAQTKGKHLKCEISDEYEITAGVDGTELQMGSAKYENGWLDI